MKGKWVSLHEEPITVPGTCQSPSFRILAKSVCCLFLLYKLPLLKTISLGIKRGPPIPKALLDHGTPVEFCQDPAVCLSLTEHIELPLASKSEVCPLPTFPLRCWFANLRYTLKMEGPLEAACLHPSFSKERVRDTATEGGICLWPTNVRTWTRL